MKTADSIAEQSERKAARDNGSQPLDSLPDNTQPVTQKRRRGDASYTARIAPWKWQPGHCPNPGGRPKHDLAAEIARAVFENNAEALYKAYTKAALKGNAYAFKELADRAFGKLKETHQVDIPYKDVPTEDLPKEITRLEIALGYRKAEEEVPPASGNSKPN